MKQFDKENYSSAIRKIFNNDFCGIDQFVTMVLKPIFGSTLIIDNAPKKIENNKDVIKNVACVGEVTGLYAQPVFIYDVTISDKCNIGRSRVYIQEAVRSDLLPFANAFIVFHYETTEGRSWRFSFAQKEDTKSSMKTAKRYTYLAGKDYSCRTVADRFATLFSNKEELKQEYFLQAFSVETLSKEFFDEYTSFYNDFVNYVTNEDKLFARFLKVAKNDEALAQKLVRDYIKKLMGRLVFIQFLQKKGWLCDDLNYLQTLFAKTSDKDKKNFLDNVLEPLFFGIFNTDTKDRKKLFEANKWNVNLLKEWKDFPYLNGGLFEADELDELKLPIPSYFFSNPEQKDTIRKPDDKYYDDACGLFDFFERYNFTIDENDPDDAEVGVDPEMLGKIFENLLEDNKDKGAFYTPKEIVQYMCRESLIAYLTEHCSKDIEEQSIRDFVCNQIKPKKGTNSLLKALQDVKICDPAIGSGAFPMGLVNELFRCRKLLGDNAHSAEIKRQIIQNNIYGVDIEKGAVDIARLRFWLSLIVEADEPKTLPNLDFKIMQGNSLLESYERNNLSKVTHTRKAAVDFDKEAQIGDLFFDNSLPEKLRNLVREYYNCDNHKQKSNIREAIIENVRMQMPNLPSSIDITANNKFFLWHTWFSDVFNRPYNCNGFDIVIGNPPYIKEYENKDAFDGFRESSPYYIGKMDLWHGFACFCIDLLKNNGILSFIAQNNWTTNAGAKKMRNKVNSDCQILQMVDFFDYMVFKHDDNSQGASIQTMIMFFKNNSSLEKYSFDYRRIISGDRKSKKEDMLNLLEKKKTSKTLYLTPTINRFQCKDKLLTFSENDEIFEKIADKKNYLQEDEIAQGIVFPQDFLDKKGAEKLKNKYPIGSGIFGLTDKELKSLCLPKNEKQLIKPYYTTEQIARYYTNPKNNKWLIYTDSSFKNLDKMKPFPTIKTHLDNYSTIMTSDFKPYGLHRSRNSMFFQGEKILSLRKCVGKPCFSYSDFDCYVTQTFFIIKTTRWDMRFLTGVLNSSLVAFWLKNKGKMQGANYQVDKEPLLNIPLPLVDKEQQKEIIKLVNKIFDEKKLNPNANTSVLEREIDKKIYEIYELDDNDIKIVEGI